MTDVFCPRCGRYLKDNEFQCPECGNLVREPPHSEYIPNATEILERGEKIDAKTIFTQKWFFIALAIAAAITFAVTYYWRFTFLFLCFPLFLPSRLSISVGTFLGVCIGSIAAIILKSMMISSAIVI